MISIAKLEYAEKRMRKQWYAMVVAGRGGSTQAELERLYEAYSMVLEEYLRCYEAYQREQGGVNIHRCA